MARHTDNSNITVTQHILPIILTQVSSLISTTQLTMMDTQDIITALIDWAGFNVSTNTVQVIRATGFYRSKDPTNSIKVLKEHRIHN